MPVATQIPDRLVWAVDILAPAPSDQVLEIGCGPGDAVSLICRRLRRGRITAIDRSPIMVRRARERNSGCIAAGTATVERGTLEDADFGRRRFDKVLAVDVNAFWTRPAPALDAVRQVLAQRGKLLLVHQPPTSAMARKFGQKLMTIVSANGFLIRHIAFKELKSGTILGVIAELPSVRR